MASQFRTDIRSFADASRVLNNQREVKIGNNTTLGYRGVGTIAACLHGTDIVTYHSDGRIIVNTGGYNTNTTRHRLNGLTNVGAYQKNGVTYLGDGRELIDGMNVGA